MDMLTMALKSFGLNPDDIKKQMQEAHDTFLKTCKHFDDRLNDIENKLNVVMEVINENKTIHVSAITKNPPIVNPGIGGNDQGTCFEHDVIGSTIA